MKLIQYKGYLVSTVDIDGLVLSHQGISSYSAENTPMHFQFLMGQIVLDFIKHWALWLQTEGSQKLTQWLRPNKTDDTQVCRSHFIMHFFRMKYEGEI